MTVHESSDLGVGPSHLAVAIGAQGLSGLSNVGVQLALALTVVPDRFGALVVGFAVYYFALALVRATVGDPMVALGQQDRRAWSDDGWRGDVLWEALRRRVLLIAAGAFAVLVGLSVVLAPVRAELTVLAFALPALLLQDGFRSWCWAQSRPGLVIVLDGAWVATSTLLAGVCVIAVGISRLAGWQLLLAWVAGGAASALLGWGMRLRTIRAERPASGCEAHRLDDLSGHEEATTRSLGRSQALLAVDANGLPVAVALLAGTTTSGGMRAAALPFMPVVTIIGALRMLTLPRLHRANTEGHVGRTTVRLTATTAATATTSTCLILAALAAVPNGWLGPTGRLVEPWFAAGAVIVAARMITMPLSDALSLGVDRQRALRIRVATTALDWTATLSAGFVGGLSAAMQARTVTALLALVAWIAAVAEALRYQDRDDPGADHEESERYVVA